MTISLENLEKLGKWWKIRERWAKCIECKKIDLDLKYLNYEPD